MFAYGATSGLRFDWNRTFQLIAIWSLSIVEGTVDMEVLIEYSHIFPSSLPSIWQPFGVLYYPSFTCNVLTSHQIRDTRIRLSLYFCPVLIAPELQGRHGVYGDDRGMLSQPLCTP